jgi:molecular chaperone HtpG
MSNMQTHRNISLRTDFDGLLRILAHNLYSEQDVFVRELLQNCHDAIVMRQDQDQRHAGRISIYLQPEERKVIFSDNGIGLNEQEIEDFVSVLGATGKKGSNFASGSSLNRKIIGQFGIGLFSAFMVGNRVTLRTKKAGNETGLEWSNKGSSNCILSTCECEYVGTEVSIDLRSGPEFERYLDPVEMRKIATKYMDFLPIPIYLNGEGPVNKLNAPWHNQIWESEEAKEQEYKSFVSKRFPDSPIEVIPIELHQPFRASGVLYISDRATPGIATAGVMDIYVNRVFVTGKDTTFLPKWARFVSGMVDSPDLEPNAARDNILRGSEAYDHLHRSLGTLIIDHLRYLAKNRPRRFELINNHHHYQLKGMALADAQFYEDVADLLLFPTNRGMMSLRDYLPKNSPMGGKAPIYYISSGGAATTLFTLADKKGLTVIDASRVFDESFIKQYAESKSFTTTLVSLDHSDQEILFDPITDRSDRAKFEQLESAIEATLRETRASVRARLFVPDDIPAVLINSPRNQAREELKYFREHMSLIGGLDESIDALTNRNSENYSEAVPLVLYVNAANPLIKRLASLSVRTPITNELMLGIYNSSFLGAPNLISKHNASIIHSQMQRLFTRILDSLDEIDSLRSEVEEARVQIISRQPVTDEHPPTSDEVVTLFMITPYSGEYEMLELAIRRVLEMPPFYFEVRLARDYHLKPRLFDNVREHISQADGFIAEISELNENVMLELGAALFQGRSRPVFCVRARTAEKSVPADIKDLLRIEYDSMGTDANLLKDAIAGQLCNETGITSEPLRALVKARRKRYLSGELLQSLQIRLTDTARRKLRSKHTTIEDFLNDSPERIGELCNLAPHLALALFGEIQSLDSGRQE